LAKGEGLAPAMTYPFYIILGLAPSIIWLLFFLRKDVHPESNRMILKIFFGGMLAAVIAAVIQIGIFSGLSWLGKNLVGTFPILFFVFYHFIVIALVEEFAKYLIVKEKVINDPEFDEPVDAMLYMIIAALGFAALENLLVLFPGKEPFLFKQTAAISSFRFIGATFLHALCSGTLGYFLALSIFEPKRKIKLILTGIIIATILHGLFNISIIKLGESVAVINNKLVIIDFPIFIFSFVFLIALLTGLALFVSFGFKKLKKIASICKVTRY